MIHTDHEGGKSTHLQSNILYLAVILSSLTILMSPVTHSIGLNANNIDGKSLFYSLQASECNVNCMTAKIRPVCGTDDVTYLSRCELKRAKKCGGKRVRVKRKGRCNGDGNSFSKCLVEKKEATENARRGASDVLIPTCNKDGSYSQIQCYKSLDYCWCVTKDGRHIPGTSLKGGRPRSCKGKRKRKRGRGRSRRKRNCNNKDRQVFNTALIKVFKEEYDRAKTMPPPKSKGSDSDEFGTEKAIVEWKFHELDPNKDGVLKFKEIRNFGRMVKKLIKPRNCARRFLNYCDKKRDRSIEKTEWTLCLGVDIKSNAGNGGGGQSPVDRVGDGMYLRPSSSFLKEQNSTPLRPRPSSNVKSEGPEKKETSQGCPEERDAAMIYHSQEPDARHYIPVCTPMGLWEKAQCHRSTGYCWCVQETNGIPIPGTATYRIKPNCSFENEREMKGCPFHLKRRFLVDLIGDLIQERREVLKQELNLTDVEPDRKLLSRETVARWKLKTLDLNNSGVLEKKEWRTIRQTTLKKKNFHRKCRRSFLRYCDEDNNRKITFSEWKDCLGLNYNHFNTLPLNPKRKGKNPFMDQLT